MYLLEYLAESLYVNLNFQKKRNLDLDISFLMYVSDTFGQIVHSRDIRLSVLTDDGHNITNNSI